MSGWTNITKDTVNRPSCDQLGKSYTSYRFAVKPHSPFRTTEQEAQTVTQKKKD